MKLVLIITAVLLGITQCFNPATNTTFTLYTRRNPYNGQLLPSITGGASLTSTNFNAADPIRFIIHGWKRDGTVDTNTMICDAYLKKGEFNVIVVDWKDGASDPIYVGAAMNVEGVGKAVAAMIQFIRSQFPGTHLDITLVGHSLGAHIAGFAGRNLKEYRVQNIVALDPANPLFGHLPLLIPPVSSGDAEYVQAIQTNRGMLGEWEPLGHASFFPNYGPMQPGCACDLIGGCAHNRSFHYFAESINAGPSNNFLGRKCRNKYDIALMNCVSSGTSRIMGGEPLDADAVGIYFMTTESTYPYGKGEAGIREGM